MAASEPGGLVASYTSVGELVTSVQSRWVAGEGKKRAKTPMFSFPAGRNVKKRAGSQAPPVVVSEPQTLALQLDLQHAVLFA
jgi:hypothetical protein